MNISELKSALEKSERQLKAAGADDERAFAQKKIDKLKAQIADAEKEGEPKKKDEPVKSEGKKRGRKPGSTKPKLKSDKPKAKKFIEYKGTKYYEGSDEYCRLGKKIIEERKAARKKSGGKHKTKSVSYKIGEDIADAVQKAVKSVPIADVKESPEKYVKRFKDLLKAGQSFVSTFRAVLGEEYDNSEIKDSLETVEALIDDIKKKVKTSFRKKMAKGGSLQIEADDEKTRKEIAFLEDKGYYIDAYSDGTSDAFFEVDNETLRMVQGSKGFDVAIAYFIDEFEEPITKKMLRHIKSEFWKNQKITLYTNAGVEVHSKEMEEGNTFEGIKIVRVSLDDINKLAKGGSVGDSMTSEIVRGYFSAVLFAENDDEDQPLDSNYGVEDFDSKTVSEVKKMISRYVSENKDAIEESGLDYDTVGMDIWYAQKGHGAGFFDHSLDKDIEDKLTNSAKSMGRFPDVEVGDDGKIHIRGINKK